MKATTMLKHEHATVKGLFQRFEQARGSERKRKIFEEIKAALDRHAQVEEETFYPVVRAAAKDSEDVVLEAIEEHNVVKTLLGEIDSMSPEDEEYDAKVKVLQENVEHHIEEEEGEMFPKAERALGDRLDEIGSTMQAREESLEQPVTTRIVQSVKNLIFGESGGDAGSVSSRESGAGRRTAKRAESAAKKTPRSRGRREAARGASAKSASSRGKKATARTSGNRTGAHGRGHAIAAGRARKTATGARAQAPAAPPRQTRTRTKAASARATARMRSARRESAGARGKTGGTAPRATARSRSRRGR